MIPADKPFDGPTKRALVECSKNGPLIKVMEIIKRYPQRINDSIDAGGFTSLLHAAVGGQTETIKFLLEKGARINKKSNNGYTALMLATYWQKVEVVKILHENGADLNLMDNNGFTPLMTASRFGLTELVKLLLELGADTTLKHKSGKRAFELACFEITDKSKVKEIQTLLDGKKKKRTVAKVADSAQIEAEQEVEGENKMKFNLENISRVLAKGTKEWGRSRLMIVGQGRAGKTALSNSIMGKPYSQTNSTIGISQFTCDVKFASFNKDGNWENYQKPEREFENALANLLLQQKAAATTTQEHLATDHQNSEKKDASKDNFPAKLKTLVANSSAEKELPAAEGNHHSDQGEVLVESENKNVHDPLKNLNLQLDKLVNPMNQPVPESKVDNDILMKCLSNQISSITNSKFIISLYDFGGQSIFNVIHPFFLTKYGIYLIVFNMEWLIPSSSAENNLHTPVTSVQEGETQNEEEDSSKKNTSKAGDDHFSFENMRDECITFLKFWINSIILHTYNPITRETASVIFIGTRKDKITSPTDHQKISLLLYELFHNSLIWPFVIENPFGMNMNGRNSLWFFPINNVLSSQDETMQSLLTIIEETVDSFPYVHQEISLQIFQFLDVIQSYAAKSSFITYSAMKELAKTTLFSSTSAAGVSNDQSSLSLMNEEESFQQILLFFHEMGILFYYSSHPILKEMIILNPIDYFIKPVTTIICKHVPTVHDTTLHLLDIHKSIRKKYFYEWKDMTEKGILCKEILLGLLQEYSSENQQIILELMKKYSLLVPLITNKEPQEDSKEAKQSSTTISYLCPSLLPTFNLLSLENQESQQQQYHSMGFQQNLKWENSILFYFTLSIERNSIFHADSSFSSSLSLQEMIENGFLPNGFYERFICKLIQMSNQSKATTIFTSFDNLLDNNQDSDHKQDGDEQQAVSQHEFYRNYSLLSFGNQYFRISNYEQFNCLVIDIEGKNPYPIYLKIIHELSQMMKLENLSSLQCIPVVPYSITMERNTNLAGSAHKTFHSIRKDSIFLKLWKILDVLDIDQDSLLSILSKETHFSSNQQQQSRKKGLTELTLMINGARSILSKKQIYEIYCNWALQNPFRNITNDKNKNTSMNYDVFLSYRWNKFDSLLVDRFYELSPFYSINSDKRLLSIFLDKKRLLDGRDFSTDFTSSLLHSRIVTPIISFKALEKMFSLQEDSPVDNLLLEWIISIHCFMLKQSQQQQNQDLEGNNLNFIRIERIFPIFIGSIEVQEEEELINPPSRPLSGKPTRPISATNQSKHLLITNITNLFSENILSRIPEIIPVHTLEKAQEIFSYYSIPFLKRN